MKYTTINRLIKVNYYDIDYGAKEISVNLTNGDYQIIVKVNKDDDLYIVDNNINLRYKYVDYLIDYYTEIWDMHFKN